MQRDPIVFRAIGQPLPRKEDYRLLTGTGSFSDDRRAKGEAYAVMVRSPHAHARIGAVDIRAALGMPGVLAVYTGEDCVADGLRPIPHTPLPSTRHDMKLTGPGGAKIFAGPHHLLPCDRVRHVGEAVAMVVAETAAQAADAAERVQVDYEEMAAVVDAEQALQPGAPQLWPQAPHNLLVDSLFGDGPATEQAFAAADHIVRMRHVIPRVTAVALEPRSALGEYDTETGRYTLHAGSGGAVRQKHEIAAALAIDPDRLRVVCREVGGNFGSKNRPYVEYGLVLWAAGKLHRAVKFTASRSEAFLSDYQGRDLVNHVELALRADGTFLGMRARHISNVGARCVSLSPLGKGAGLITGPYRIAAATLRAQAAFTNTMPTNAYRSSGRPEVTYALERLIDRAARELRLDRVAVRRMNLVAPGAMPYTNAVGARYDSGEYESNMDRAMRLADWGGFDDRRRAAHAKGVLLGRGLANYVESSIGFPRERAELSVAPDRVTVVIGTQPSGQGHETSFAQVVSDLLGVPVDAIDVNMGDTDVVRTGGGSHSGRSMRHAATVLAMAADRLIDHARRLAAQLHGIAVDDVAWSDGALHLSFGAPRPAAHCGLLQLAAEAAARGLPPEFAGGLHADADNEMHDPVFPNGCAVCECEVDPETGSVRLTRYAAVDDVGRCINPLIVHGQTHGAIAQGIGQALGERCFIDDISAQPLCGTLMDYGLPRADDLPSFSCEIVEVLSPTNPLGIKAGGEGGTTPAPAVVVSAILDALAPLGVTELELPATPHRVWRAIRQAKTAS